MIGAFQGLPGLLWDRSGPIPPHPTAARSEQKAPTPRLDFRVWRGVSSSLFRGPHEETIPTYYLLVSVIFFLSH